MERRSASRQAIFMTMMMPLRAFLAFSLPPLVPATDIVQTLSSELRLMLRKRIPAPEPGRASDRQAGRQAGGEGENGSIFFRGNNFE